MPAGPSFQPPCSLSEEAPFGNCPYKCCNTITEEQPFTSHLCAAEPPSTLTVPGPDTSFCPGQPGPAASPLGLVLVGRGTQGAHLWALSQQRVTLLHHLSTLGRCSTSLHLQNGPRDWGKCPPAEHTAGPGSLAVITQGEFSRDKTTPTPSLTPTTATNSSVPTDI